MPHRWTTNPYGKPGRGNYDEIWRHMRTPCTECGARKKTLKIEEDKATIICS